MGSSQWHQPTAGATPVRNPALHGTPTLDSTLLHVLRNTGYPVQVVALPGESQNDAGDELYGNGGTGTAKR